MVYFNDLWDPELIYDCTVNTYIVRRLNVHQILLLVG